MLMNHMSAPVYSLTLKKHAMREEVSEQCYWLVNIRIWIDNNTNTN